MSTILLFTSGVLLGLSLKPRLDAFFYVEIRAQVKAICNKFGCKKNEFTYYLEDEDGYYIVSLKNQEYRIKFSMNNPCQIVYSQEVERASY